LRTPQLVEHFFRHEYGRLVAILSRQFGLHRLEAVEDAVQGALMTALESWSRAGVPENPEAWLYRVARNNVLGELRQRARHDSILDRHGEAAAEDADPAMPMLSEAQIQDDLLRMLFVCCDEDLPVESQRVLALKTLCGFDVREIAHRLFMSEAHVYKRLARARARFQERPLPLEGLSQEQYASRLEAVQQILYVLFTEGYLSSHAEAAIRQELCDEALRLTRLLAEHPVGQTPETCALLALMYLHAARLKARQDDCGLLLLEEQDRSLWDQRMIQTGLEWLAQSARGERLSRFHAEAAIAAEHCLAPTFEQTRWDKVAENYALLEQLAPSALHRLNRAVATAEWQGPTAGLAVLEGFAPPSWLAISYLWAAVLADLHGRSGNTSMAQQYRDNAIRAAPNAAVQKLLQRRLVGGES
jgi:RNA polymerase sigma-70 factor (ECF subfamily)